MRHGPDRANAANHCLTVRCEAFQLCIQPARRMKKNTADGKWGDRLMARVEMAQG